MHHISRIFFAKLFFQASCEIFKAGKFELQCGIFQARLKISRLAAEFYHLVLETFHSGCIFLGTSGIFLADCRIFVVNVFPARSFHSVK